MAKSGNIYPGVDADKKTVTSTKKELETPDETTEEPFGELATRAPQSMTHLSVSQEEAIGEDDDELLFADDETNEPANESSIPQGALTVLDALANSNVAGAEVHAARAVANIEIDSHLEQSLAGRASPWKILIVDDEPDVIKVTQLCLNGLEVMGRPVELICADSGTMAREILNQNIDIAVVITDVVMESADAGLGLIQWLRASERGKRPRVVVRTGQPGFAPEEFVLKTYDINDYWPKTSIDSGRMRSQVMGLVRSFDDIQKLHWQSSQLQRLADSVNTLLGLETIEQVFDHLEEEMSALSIFWSCFSTDGSRWDSDTLEVLDQSPRNPSQMRHLVTQIIGEAFHSNDSTVVIDGMHFAVAHTSIAGGKHITLLFGRNGGTQSFSEFLGLRGSIYSQAIRNALLNHQTQQLLLATKRFVPQQLISLLSHADITEIRSGDHVTVEAWVMFLDIRGFTARAERMELEQSHALLQQLFVAFIPKIEAFGGVVDKFLGDGLLALFQSQQAPIECALDLVDLIRTVDDSIKLSIGIHGGPVNLCALGYRDRLEVTAIADTVNIAARLEQANRRYNSTIIASQDALDSFSNGESVACNPLGELQLRGRSGLVRAVEILPRPRD